jgi:hypothetical protein
MSVLGVAAQGPDGEHVGTTLLTDESGRGVDLVAENYVNSSRYYYYEVSAAIPETKFFIVNPDSNDTKNGTPVPHTATSCATSAPLPVTVSGIALIIVGVYAGIFRK